MGDGGYLFFPELRRQVDHRPADVTFRKSFVLQEATRDLLHLVLAQRDRMIQPRRDFATSLPQSLAEGSGIGDKLQMARLAATRLFARWRC